MAIAYFRACNRGYITEIVGNNFFIFIFRKLKRRVVDQNIYLYQKTLKICLFEDSAAYQRAYKEETQENHTCTISYSNSSPLLSPFHLFISFAQHILPHRIITHFLTSKFVRFGYGAIVAAPRVRFALSLAQSYKTQVSCRGLARALTAKITNSLYSR